MSGAIPPLTLYIHFPWCVSKCPYCDFNSHREGETSRRPDYLEALAADLRFEAERADGRRIHSVFLGGGTPSLFHPLDIARVLDHLRENFSLASDAEITMEANPGTLECGRLAGYREAGVNRLSLGAQSFDDDALAGLGRIHRAADVSRAFAEARSAGFNNINIDLMFALPGQDAAGAAADLDTALSLSPEHLSYYQLTLEPNTVFHRRPPPDLPDPDAAADMHDASIAALAAAGFHRYEVSAFARPERECRHNLNYWRFGDYLGVGAGAHGKHTVAEGSVTRTRKSANPAQYIGEWRPGPGRDHAEAVGHHDLAFEYMLNALRLTAGFTAAHFEARTGRPFADVRGVLAGLAGAGLMAFEAGAGTGQKWATTDRGLEHLNELQAAFLPAAGDAQRGTRGAEITAPEAARP